MPEPTPEPGLWKNIAVMLDEMDDRSLRGLARDLYKLTAENRAFLAAWIGDEDASIELLDWYKAKVAAQFVSRGAPRMKGGCDLAQCRRLIKECRRVTTAPEMFGGFDICGTIDLGPHYIKFGTNYVSHVGWDKNGLTAAWARRRTRMRRCTRASAASNVPACSCRESVPSPRRPMT